MYLIKGIKHLRCVGVWDMPDGKAEDFDLENAGGYRSPQSEEERRACIAKALDYYNGCGDKTGDFGIEPITAEQAELLGDFSAEASMAAMDFEDWLHSKSRHCRYCKNLFIPNAPGQKVCKRPECQRERKNEKARNYKRRKKSKSSQDPA